MPARIRLLVLSSLWLAACGASASVAPPPPSGGSGGGSSGANSNAGGGGGTDEGPSESGGFATHNLELRADGTVVLGPDFRPTPVVLAGQNGGPTEAYSAGSAVGAYCYGYLPLEPQHVIEVTAPITNLRIVVDTYRASDASGSYGSVDSTLFVRVPGGAIWCDDDGGGDLQPVVEGPILVPGTVEIFVGAYSASGTGAYYKLALTENPDYTHADLR